MRTFILRLQEQAGAGAGAADDAPQLRGFVDEVATGLRAIFRNEQELVAALTAVVADRPGPRWNQGQRVVTGFGPAPDTTETIFEEQ